MIKGREIVDKALAAMGGSKFQSMRNRVEEGRLYSFYRERLSGLATARIYTDYLEKPVEGKLNVRERQSFGKKEEDFAYLFTPEEALQITFRGIRPFPAEQYERFKDSTMRNIFYILRFRLNEPGMIFEFRESTVVENYPVDIVDITDSENRTVSVSFHRSTHLPLRQRFERRDPEYKRLVEELTIFNKYRDVGGMQWPWSIVRYRDGDRIFEMYSEAVKIDTKLDPQLFAPPAGAKRLKQ
jgi:hypothetical protein